MKTFLKRLARRACEGEKALRALAEEVGDDLMKTLMVGRLFLGTELNGKLRYGGRLLAWNEIIGWRRRQTKSCSSDLSGDQGGEFLCLFLKFDRFACFSRLNNQHQSSAPAVLQVNDHSAC